MSNPFIGKWSYRSFYNDPDLTKSVDTLVLGSGTIDIQEVSCHGAWWDDRRIGLGARAARLIRLRLAHAGAVSGQRIERRGRVDLRLHRLADAGLAEQRRNVAAKRDCRFRDQNHTAQFR